MNISLLLLIIILGLYIIIPGDKKGRNCYIIIIMSFLAFISIFRGYSVGPDTPGYISSFFRVMNMTWRDIVINWNEGARNKGYYIFVKIIQVFTNNYLVYSFIINTIYYYFLGLILSKFIVQKEHLLIAFSLITEVFLIITLSGVRQQIVISISFASFLLWIKKYKIIPLILLILGTFIHVSGIFVFVVLILYLIPKEKIKNVHLACLIIAICSYFYTSDILVYISNYIEDEYYANYGRTIAAGGGYYLIAFFEFFSIIAFLSIPLQELINDNSLYKLYLTVPLTTLTIPYISHNGAFIRIAEYFTIYMTIIIPYSVDKFFIKYYKNKAKIYTKIIIYVLFCMFVVISLRIKNDYTFIWQDPYRFK